MEYQLFEHLFSGADGGTALAPLVDSLATSLYDTLRPAFIQLQDLASLCQLVQILQREVCPRYRTHICSSSCTAHARAWIAMLSTSACVACMHIHMHVYICIRSLHSTVLSSAKRAVGHAALCVHVNLCTVGS